MGINLDVSSLDWMSPIVKLRFVTPSLYVMVGVFRFFTTQTSSDVMAGSNSRYPSFFFALLYG